MKTLADRLAEKIKVQDSGCWNWVGYVDAQGYGYLGVNYKNKLAHRVSYETLRGPIPDGLEIDHLCRNKRCVNPDHLEPVTRLVNERRKPRPPKAVCRNGHVQDEETRRVSFRSNGAIHRACRKCEAAASWRYKQRHAEEVSL